MSELAALLEISVPTMSEWESGNIAMLYADKMMRACAALNIAPTWLMFGEGEVPVVRLAPKALKSQSYAAKMACVFFARRADGTRARQDTAH